jgi:histidine phosphotransfer protein HptB
MSTTTEPVDRTKLAELEELGGGREFVGEVVGAFLSDGDARVAALEVAVAENDGPRWLREAHTMKSSTASVGATVLGAVCKRIEAEGREGRPCPPDALEEVRAEWSRVKEFFEGWLRG